MTDNTFQTLATLYELDRRARAAGVDGWWPEQLISNGRTPSVPFVYEGLNGVLAELVPEHALTLVTEEAEQWLSDRDWCLSTLEPGLISRDAWTLKVANLLTIEVEAIEKDSNKENDDE